MQTVILQKSLVPMVKSCGSVVDFPIYCLGVFDQAHDLDVLTICVAQDICMSCAIVVVMVCTSQNQAGFRKDRFKEEYT